MNNIKKPVSLKKIFFGIAILFLLVFIIGTGWIPILNINFLEGNLFFDSTSNLDENYTIPNVILMQQDWQKRTEGAPDENDILLKFGMQNTKSIPIYLREMTIGYKGYGLRGRNFKLYEISENTEKFVGEFECTEGCDEKAETVMNDNERFIKARFKYTDDKGVKIFDTKEIKSFIIKGEVAIFNEVNNSSNKARGMVWIEKGNVLISSSKRGETFPAIGWINSYNNASNYLLYSEIKKFE